MNTKDTTPDTVLITLPSATVMMDNLIKVDDDRVLSRCFYDKLIKQCGKAKQPLGVLVMLELALQRQ